MIKITTIATANILLCLSFLNALPQQITIALNPIAQADICAENTVSGFMILDQPFPLSFEFELSAIVRNGNNIISLPVTPSPTYIPCGDNAVNKNPATNELINSQFQPSDACVRLSASPQFFTPADNKYKWTVNVNAGQCLAV